MLKFAAALSGAIFNAFCSDSAAVAVFSQLGIRHRLVDHGQHCPRLELERGVIGCNSLFAITAAGVVVAQVVIGVPLVRT